MHDRKANIDENAVEFCVSQDCEEGLQGMLIDISLKKVVKAIQQLLVYLVMQSYKFKL